VPFALVEWMRFGHHPGVDTEKVESSVAESAAVSRFTYWFVLPGVATWFGIQVVRAIPGADSFVMAFAACVGGLLAGLAITFAFGPLLASDARPRLSFAVGFVLVVLALVALTMVKDHPFGVIAVYSALATQVVCVVCDSIFHWFPRPVAERIPRPDPRE
jgi:hypothetical protein